jgi:HlyD family secretion protein
MPLSASQRKLLYAVLGAVAIGAVAWGFVPDPISVEATRVRRGPLQVTVDEDAETRAHDRYVVSAPATGRVSRIELHEGDAVRAGQVVARIWPAELTVREREVQRARIAAAEALAREAQERVRHAESDYEQAKRERLRVDRLVREGFMSPQGAEQSRVQETTSANELQAARFRVRAAQADAEAARAVLLAVGGERGSAGAVISVRSAVEGKVLRIPDKSERVVGPGAPLLVVGDPGRLEVVIDLLSTEAVKVKSGMPVLLDGWGGDRPLRARVRVVEPLAFTKVSALGVEEQRVNVIADFVDSPGPLGDAYRVEAHVVLWSGDDVLTVPVSALFRRGENWNVFVVDGARARRREVTIGHRGALEVEVASGLSAGELVLRHPSNDIDEGRRVRVAKQK